MTLAAMPLRHQSIEDARRGGLFATLVKGNVVLRGYVERFRTAMNVLTETKRKHFGGSLEELRERLFLPKGDRFRINPEYVDLSAADMANLEILRGIKLTRDLRNNKRWNYRYLRTRLDLFLPLMSEEERAAVHAVSAICGEIRSGHIRLVQSIFRQFRQRCVDRCCSLLEEDDLLQEGLIALENAIWGYSRPDIKFTTYATWAVRRAMLRALSRGQQFGGMVTRCERLLASYYQALLVTPEGAAFDTVIEHMKVRECGTDRAPSEDEVELIRRLFSTFLRDGDGEDASTIDNIPDHMDSGPDIEQMTINDLIARALPTAAERKVLDDAKRSSDAALRKKAQTIRRCKLTDGEHQILLMAMEQKSRRGFRQVWATEHNVSRAMAGKVAKRAYNKLEIARRTA